MSFISRILDEAQFALGFQKRFILAINFFIDIKIIYAKENKRKWAAGAQLVSFKPPVLTKGEDFQGEEENLG